MNQAVLEKWTAALRSGRYEQGHCVLRSKYGYCCLGVLCEIAVEDGVIEDYLGSYPVPPDEVLRWADLADLAYHCIKWNDDYRHSFERIAEQLEERQARATA